MTEQDRKRLKDVFTTYLPLPVNLEPHLREALGQVLRNPGSLFRPEIVLEISLGYGLSETDATDLAIGLEYFHTASLLFDDLPSMDDAVERRGIPCVHLEFGDAGAILAALALINRAYALIWRAVSSSLPERRSTALAYVERYLGVGGLLNGQSMDLHYATLPHNRQMTEQIAMGKTVSLIRLTLVLPAILGLLIGTGFLFTLKLIPALHGYVDVTIQPLVVLIVIVLALLTSVAGALYPASYAMRIRAVEALRFE
jgi:geranylgeranyl diphosphate synthase type II